MIIMGIEFTGQVPFSTVFLHGLVSCTQPPASVPLPKPELCHCSLRIRQARHVVREKCRHDAGLPTISIEAGSDAVLFVQVRDGQGRKMSKSIGNVVDPVEVISQYGTDALRFTLATGELPGSLQQLLLLSPLTRCVGM